MQFRSPLHYQRPCVEIGPRGIAAVTAIAITGGITSAWIGLQSGILSAAVAALIGTWFAHEAAVIAYSLWWSSRGTAFAKLALPCLGLAVLLQCCAWLFS